jgi:hypothetical protein
MTRTRLILRLIGCAVLAVITLELCARIEDRVRFGAPFFGPYSSDSIYTYDAIGKRGRANASYLKWRLNEAGYRGPALRSGTTRIVCIGSSETFGLYEAEGHEWPRELETVLHDRTASERFEVINTAYPGMTIMAAVRRVPELLGLQPQVAVIYPSYANYVGRTAADRTKIAKAVPEKFEWRIAGRLESLAKASLPEWLQHRMRKLQVERSLRGVEQIDRVPESTVQLFESDLEELTSRLEQAGVRVILVTHATRFGETVRSEDRKYLTDWRKSYPELRESGFLDMESRMRLAVERVAVRNRAELVDAATEIQPGSANFAEFVHFTDAGAHNLATLVADEMLKSAGAWDAAAANKQAQ